METSSSNYQLDNSQIIKNQLKLIKEWKPQHEVYVILFCHIIHTFFVNIVKI